MSQIQWCVYLHKRPDGSVFYVGKGKTERARDFAPSRRTQWHKNVVAKHGRQNILIEILPCQDEMAAFALERERIAAAKAAGECLANLTDGGEGCAGRAPTAAQIAALAKGRIVGKRGAAGPRPQLDAWKQTPAGIEHLSRLGQIGAMALHRERHQDCAECGTSFVTTSAKAKCCGRLCEQRYRRAGKNE